LFKTCVAMKFVDDDDDDDDGCLDVLAPPLFFVNIYFEGYYYAVCNTESHILC